MQLMLRSMQEWHLILPAVQVSHVQPPFPHLLSAGCKRHTSQLTAWKSKWCVCACFYVQACLLVRTACALASVCDAVQPYLVYRSPACTCCMAAWASDLGACWIRVPCMQHLRGLLSRGTMLAATNMKPCSPACTPDCSVSVVQGPLISPAATATVRLRLRTRQLPLPLNSGTGRPSQTPGWPPSGGLKPLRPAAAAGQSVLPLTPCSTSCSAGQATCQALPCSWSHAGAPRGSWLKWVGATSAPVGCCAWLQVDRQGGPQGQGGASALPPGG